MGPPVERRRRVEVDGEPALLDKLGDPIRRVLSERGHFYRVHLEGTGRCGEVVVAIDGTKGRLPLIFAKEDLEPGYVASVILHTVERFAF